MLLVCVLCIELQLQSLSPPAVMWLYTYQCIVWGCRIPDFSAISLTLTSATSVVILTWCVWSTTPSTPLSVLLSLSMLHITIVAYTWMIDRDLTAYTSRCINVVFSFTHLHCVSGHVACCSSVVRVLPLWSWLNGCPNEWHTSVHFLQSAASQLFAHTSKSYFLFVVLSNTSWC